MASANLSLAVAGATRVTFQLVSTSLNKTAWIVSGRKLATPYQISIERKLVSGKGNDQVILRVLRIENNATTGLPATALVTLSASIPKDQSILTTDVCKQLLVVVGSFINDFADGSATTSAATSFLEGRDV